ncbi:MAG TPA: TCP-1/cpn60 chaperonin family protein [Herpetosiphonaceae bacterium]|nr:TCP-1/cpn60 chaperonin family protein [Herpetosiphonaceae bacterium]
MPESFVPGVVFQPRSHQGMQRGINQIVDVVRPTLGPRPRVVAVENVFRERTPEFLDNAGVIARRIIQLADRDADMGAMLVRHLLWQLHEQAGDGTATAAVIFQTVYNRGLRYLVSGGNAMQLRRCLERGMCEILDELNRQTLRVEGKAKLTEIAEALCFDPELARLLGEIFDIVGEYGQVNVRTGNRRALERHYTEGMYWKSSILSPYMLTDQAKLRTDLTNAAVLISDLELEDPRALMPVLDIAMQAEIRVLLVVASKLSDSSIALLLAASREPEKFQVIAAQTPGMGSVEQAAAMEDLGILTGGRLLLKVAGDTLRRLKVEDLGHARRAWSDKTHLGIVGGKGDPRVLRRHIANLRAAFAAADDAQLRTRLQERIGKLMGGSATLLVGGNSEVEIAAREELARRTSKLLRTALREGVVPGGGTALLACRARVRRLLEASTNPDETAAYHILHHALEEPFRTIMTNAGYDAGTVLADVDRAGEGFGFDVRLGQVVDMVQAGITDVAAAQKAAFRGAVAAAATALTIDILVHKRNPVSTAGRP